LTDHLPGRRKVMIVGSGFAGLTLALFLKRKLIPSVVFDGIEDASTWGGTVTIFPNGMSVLSDLGLSDLVQNAGAVITKAIFKDHFGNHFSSFPMGTAERYGHPTITIKRSALYSILYQAAQRENVEILFRKDLVRFKESEQYVTAFFKDGSSFEGSCIIGADGVNSTVRRGILSEKLDPQYAGLIFCGGFVSAANFELKPNLELDKQHVIVGPQGFFGYSYIDLGQQLFWYCYLPQSERLSKKQLEELSDLEIKQRVLENHLSWCEPIHQLVERTQSFSKANVYDLQGLNKWSTKRGLVIGDAAHAMNPISGQGASTAMEDAQLLSEMLERDTDNFESTFNLFELQRKPRVEKIAARARKSSARTQIRFSPMGCLFRNLVYAFVVKLTPESHLNWAFGYRVKGKML
jgi:2-polyprenyl-6-methoxyphenol hydroxylase-like FAD-dependent oxidoreductase